MVKRGCGELNKESQWWGGEKGTQYTDDSMLMTEEEKLFERKHGITLESVYDEFFGELDRNYRILEIGCNVGHKLRRLSYMGFKNLYGIDINPFAVAKCKATFDNVHVVQGNALEWETGEEYDLVMTNFVQQHINPKQQVAMANKIKSLSTKYVFFLEFWDKSEEPIEVEWRGMKGTTWKRDWTKLYNQTWYQGKTNMIKRPDGFTDIATLYRKFD